MNEKTIRVSFFKVLLVRIFIVFTELFLISKHFLLSATLKKIACSCVSKRKIWLSRKLAEKLTFFSNLMHGTSRKMQFSHRLINFKWSKTNKIRDFISLAIKKERRKNNIGLLLKCSHWISFCSAIDFSPFSRKKSLWKKAICVQRKMQWKFCVKIPSNA